jgi:hypothetical protein
MLLIDEDNEALPEEELKLFVLESERDAELGGVLLLVVLKYPVKDDKDMDVTNANNCQPGDFCLIYPNLRLVALIEAVHENKNTQPRK